MTTIRERSAKLMGGKVSTESSLVSPQGLPSLRPPHQEDNDTEPAQQPYRYSPEDVGAFNPVAPLSSAQPQGTLMSSASLPEGIEVVDPMIEVDRAAWVTLVHLCLLLSPDLYYDLRSALTIGEYPIVGVHLSSEASAALQHMISLVFGGSPIVVPIVRLVPYCTDNRGLVCPKKVHDPIPVCYSPPVLIQIVEESSCSPYEIRVLNAKQSLSRSKPLEAVDVGLRLASGTYSSRLPLPLPPPSLMGTFQPAGTSPRSLKRGWIRRIR